MENNENSSDLRCADYFGSQYGLISRPQALAAGQTPRSIDVRLATGRWEALLPRTYGLVGVPESWRRRLMAASLWSGGLVSHRAAAALWGLDGSIRGRIEVTIPGSNSRSVHGIVQHRTQRLHLADHATVDGIPTTTIGRTLVDLGAVERTGRVQAALDHALRDGRVSLSILQAHLDRLGGHGRRGAGVLRNLLNDPELLYRPPASVFERTLVPQLARLNVPKPIRQYAVYDDEGFIGSIDFAWPQVKLGLEADSWEHHSKRGDWIHDRRRRNRMTSVGWHILHGTWDDTKNPENLARYIAAFFVRSTT